MSTGPFEAVASAVEVVFESPDLGPLAVHRGRLFVMQADPAIRPKEDDVAEAMAPTPRWHVVEIDVTTRTVRRRTAAPVMKPHRLIVDDAGVVLVGGRELRFCDHELREVAVVAVGSGLGVGEACSEAELTFVENNVNRDTALCRIDRATRRIERESLGRRIEHVGGNAQLLAWTHGSGHPIEVVERGTAQRRSVEVSSMFSLRMLRAVGDALLAIEREHALVVRRDLVTRVPLGTLSGMSGGDGWFAKVPFTAAVGGSEHEHYASGVARIDREVQLVYAARLAADGRAEVMHIAVDERRVCFVERSLEALDATTFVIGDPPGSRCRVLSLPLDAASIERPMLRVPVRERRVARRTTAKRRG